MLYRFVVYDSNTGRDVGYIEEERDTDEKAMEFAERWVEMELVVRVERVPDPVTQVVEVVDELLPIVTRCLRQSQEV